MDPKRLQVAILWGVVVVSLGSTTSAHAQRLTTGALWNAAPQDFKLGYVSGMEEGVAWLAAVDTRVAPTANLYICDCSRSNMVKGIDAIYADPANINVSVHFAYRAHIMRVSGVSDEIVQALLQEARRIGTEHKQKP